MKLDQPWAKTAPTGETRSLIAHCHHVAVMARQLMVSPVLRGRLAAAFEAELTDAHLDRLAILAGIHDFGKALKGFQDKLEGSSLTSRRSHLRAKQFEDAGHEISDARAVGS